MENKEDTWCIERRGEVICYLKDQGVNHGRVSEWPVWNVYPYTSSWAIESKTSPESVGWWVIAGDHPTDYVSSENIKEPREAYKVIAENWLLHCNNAETGKEQKIMHIKLDSQELIDMLRSRAETFIKWVSEDEHWEYD